MLKLTAIIAAALAHLSCSTVTHIFYSGLSFGATHMSGIRNDSASDVAESVNFSVNKKTRSNGGYGGVLAGYMLRIADFGIGSELFYNYGKIESNTEGVLNDAGNNLTVNFRMKNKIYNQYGMGIRLGYFLESYFIYTYLGQQRQSEKFEILANRSENYVNNVHFFKKKKQTNRFNFGFGTQKSVSEHIDIGFEYRTSRIPKNSYVFSLKDAEQTTAKGNFKYRLHTIAVRLIYKF